MGAKLTLEGTSTGAVAAVKELQSAVDKIEKGAQVSAREMAKLEQAAVRMAKSAETPMERYNRQIEIAETGYKRNKISAEQLSAIVLKLTGEYNKATETTRKLTAAEEHKLDVEKRYQAELQRQIAAMPPLISSTQKLMGEYTQTGVSLDKVSGGLKSVAGAQEQSFGAAALSKFTAYVTGLLSVSTAIAVVRSEFEAIQADAEKTNQAQMTEAAARDVLKRNISSLGLPQARAFEGRADSLASELQLPQKYIDQGLASAISSSGGDVEAAFSRVRVAAQFLKTRPEGIGDFSGALGDVAKSTHDPNAMRNLGFLLKVGANSRVTDDKQLAESVPVALAGATTYGATAEEGGALFDALSAAAADTEGRLTGTGVIRSAEQLKDYFNKKVKEKKFAPTAVDTWAERLTMLRQNPKLAREFVEDASFEAKVKGPLEQFFLDPNSPIAKEYGQFLGSFGNPASQIKEAEDTIGYLGEGNSAHTAAVSRAIQSGDEQYRLTQDGMLSVEDREKIIERNRQLSERLSVTNRLDTVLHTGPTMSPSEAASELERGLTYGRLGGLGMDGQGPNQELIKSTEQIIATLKAIERNQKQPTPQPHGRPE